MTCKECIHYEACHDMYYEEHATRHFDPEKHNAEKECGYFKDRSRFVELDPCEGGEIITLEDAIAHCYEVADGKANACEECRAEHMMLGAWLRELKLRREQEMQKPLGIGDTVHFVLRELDEIDLKEYKFTVGKSAVSDTVQFITEIGTYGFWVGESPREFAPDYDEFYHWHELGKTVFLTREEAEQALKGRENDTPEAAIIRLNQFRTDKDERDPAIDMAIRAINRCMIKRKPIDDGKPLLKCPACRTSIDEFDSENYCFNCGQALDWGEGGSIARSN